MTAASDTSQNVGGIGTSITVIDTTIETERESIFNDFIIIIIIVLRCKTEMNWNGKWHT